MVKESASAVLATHNIQSGQMAAMKAVNLGIDRRSHCLHFAQLYGMAEALLFGLAKAGFNVSKYMPFGPVDQIIPYLARRAEENKRLLGSSSNDIALMRDELIRRLSLSILTRFGKSVAGRSGREENDDEDKIAENWSPNFVHTFQRGGQFRSVTCALLCWDDRR